MRSRTKSDYLILFFKGVFMGIADAMPGISGGTIALLVGIYEELVNTISRLNLRIISEFKIRDFNSFWKKINGNFLITLILGISISLISFVKVSASLLENYPLFVWSFFLGLIFATIYVIFKLINKWYLTNFIILFFCIFFSVYISSFTVDVTNEISLLYIFMSGIIASSAMILPGISGSLVLVILGVYTYMIKSLDNLELVVIFTFIFGSLIGLLSFSKILKYLFKNYRDLTYTIMLGLVIGSIEKAWPWNKELAVEISNLNMFFSISLVIFGLIIVLLVERSKKQNDK
tara:strand:+ start:921 stop:1790 length:870 start_codon:yes stop_codon:yes gene_type:complete